MAWIKSDTKAILAIHDHVITNNARLDITHNDKVDTDMILFSCEEAALKVQMSIFLAKSFEFCT